MPRFQPKFKVGDKVRLVKVQAGTDCDGFLGKEFTVLSYNPNVYHKNPYNLGLLSAKSSELELVEPEDVIPTPTRKPNVKLNLNKVTFEKLGLSRGDKVKIKYVPTEEAAKGLGCNSIETGYLRDFRSEMACYSGQVGEVVGFDGNPDNESSGMFVGVRFPGSGNSQWFLPISLEVESYVIEVFKFQASAEREAVVTNNSVLTDGKSFTFALFDRLTEFLKGKPAEGARIKLEHGYIGIIRSDYLEVGCQHFPYKNITRLMAAIRVARSL